MLTWVGVCQTFLVFQSWIWNSVEFKDVAMRFHGFAVGFFALVSIPKQCLRCLKLSILSLGSGVQRSDWNLDWGRNVNRVRAVLSYYHPKYTQLDENFNTIVKMNWHCLMEGQNEGWHNINYRRYLMLRLGLLKFERSVVLQRKPGDGLVLTRGQWSWDIQEPSYYQFKGLMQYDNL